MLTEDGKSYELVDLKGCRSSGGSYKTEESVRAVDLAGDLRQVEIVPRERRSRGSE